MRIINMLSSADKIKGQGVGSAYLEQVSLVKAGMNDEFEIIINGKSKSGILHFHTIDFKHYIQQFFNGGSINVGSVHFLPETIEGSLKLPFIAKKIFYKYIISFYKKMDYLVTVNPYFIERLVSQGIDKEKLHYIPNYVSKKNFFPMSEYEVQKLKNEYDVEDSKFVVLGVGQIQTRKGVRDFIELANLNPEITFIWAGGFSFGKISDGYDELKTIVRNPPKNVKFIGIIEREKMNEIYNISDMLFMPSYNELFPMAILETMNVEKPMLLRNLDIYSGILKDYYLKGSTNEEFDSIIKNLSKDKKYYEEASLISKKGGKFYSKDFVFDQWIKFYRRIYVERFGSK